MARDDDDQDEGELKEAPAHSRGGTKSEVDDEKGKPAPKARIDDPDQPKKGAGIVKVDGEDVEVIEDVGQPEGGDEPDEKRGDEDETRGKRRRRDRKRGKELDREEARAARDEVRALLTEVGGLKAEVKSLREGQNANTEQTEATLLANTKAALNTVLNQRTQALADGDGARANELDEAAYQLRRQRDDLESRVGEREKGGGKETEERAAPTSQWSPAEVRTVKGFIDKHIPWFDAGGGNRDSRIALDISRDMTAEKWRPLDDDWDEELLERLQEALPHRFEDDQDSGRAPKRKSPPVGGRGREGGSGGGNGGGFKLRLTDAHKQALAESGHERGSPEYNSIIATWVREAKAARAQR